MYQNLLTFYKSQKKSTQVSTVAHLKGTLSTVTKQRVGGFLSYSFNTLYHSTKDMISLSWLSIN